MHTRENTIDIKKASQLIIDKFFQPIFYKQAKIEIGLTVRISFISPFKLWTNRGCLPSKGIHPRKERQVKRVEIGLAMISAATLKTKGSKPSDPDVFWGSSFRCSYSTSDSVTACREKLCSGQGEKEGEASGIVALEGVGDEGIEEMLAGQGGMAESNRNPDLMKR